MNVHLCASAYLLHLLTDKRNFASELHLSSSLFVKFFYFLGKSGELKDIKGDGRRSGEREEG